MLIEDNLKVKDLSTLVDKLINLIYLQAKEIDLIHFKLFKLERKYTQALEVLKISKNIEQPLKDKLKNEIEELQKDQEAPKGSED